MLWPEDKIVPPLGPYNIPELIITEYLSSLIIYKVATVYFIRHPIKYVTFVQGYNIQLGFTNKRNIGGNTSGSIAVPWPK